MKDKKYTRALICNTVRQLIEEMNKLEIQQKDIVSLIKDNNNFILIYYGE